MDRRVANAAIVEECQRSPSHAYSRIAKNAKVPRLPTGVEFVAPVPQMGNLASGIFGNVTRCPLRRALRAINVGGLSSRDRFGRCSLTGLFRVEDPLAAARIHRPDRCGGAERQVETALAERWATGRTSSDRRNWRRSEHRLLGWSRGRRRNIYVTFVRGR